ncbi:MAG TPA: diguanylate cyclase [Noviherbaspirillum sp.]|uniref:sensor domain-containing diguanylate cyclase n=1 Tax=Noviherbaspirillum sp. TaxID=1926288 RepID=UPI002B4937FF|nr:diguanylate cyclase [Noviherbaspirillum sp.]HJV84793.1 diguanylate cyclase [Noviherbaspirillum sp.]
MGGKHLDREHTFIEKFNMQTFTTSSLPALPPAIKRLVYLVHDNELVARDLAAHLGQSGHKVAVVASMTQLEHAMDVQPPAAVIINIGVPATIFAAANEVSRLNKKFGQGFAVLFISAHGNFVTRLAAARAGASGYFSNPLNAIALADCLDKLTVRQDILPYRILVISDDSDAAESYVSSLVSDSMEVTATRKIADGLEVLRKSRPELILIDVQRPSSDGVDLTRLIRQDDTNLDVPIVFMSSEANSTAHLNAIESGADDFLAKPVQAADLIGILTGRAQRFRTLRTLITRDGMTGLLNHVALKDQLDREIVRAGREGSPLTLAMIDIDFFKRVNDSYGHPVGDRVIRALSRLLQQRLRRGDIIGRYGGEEFAVIMPGTSSEAATGVLDSVRIAFSEIRHDAGEQRFSASFSTGIAELRTHTDANALFNAADSALYQAKHNGRNCVVTDSQIVNVSVPEHFRS